MFGGNSQKWVQPVWLLYLKNEWMEWTDFLHAGANSGKLKAISLIFECLSSEMGMAIYLVHETLKSAISLK